jgi:predicted GTPase
MKRDFKKAKKVKTAIQCEVTQNFFNGLCRIAALHGESVQDVMEHAVCELTEKEKGWTPEQLQARLDAITAEHGNHE